MISVASIIIVVQLDVETDHHSITDLDSKGIKGNSNLHTISEFSINHSGLCPRFGSSQALAVASLIGIQPGSFRVFAYVVSPYGYLAAVILVSGRLTVIAVNIKLYGIAIGILS